MTLSHELAEFIVGVQYDDLPDDVHQLTKVTFLDWLGNAIAGAHMLPARIAREVAENQGGACQSSLIGENGHCTKTSMLLATMVNGTNSHIVELDDVHKASIVHAGTVVIPAALAVAEYTHATGKQLIEAIVAGFDVCIRVGEAVTPSHYKHFHTTGTAGTFGAAAAAAKLLGLSVEQTEHALASAGTQAAGLWEFVENGSMSKHLHSAKAGMNGVLSALLAQKGFTGAAQILEGNRGFMTSLAEAYDAQKITAHLGETYKIVENCFKIHSSCRHTHAAMDVAIDLAQKYNLDSQDIAQIEVGTYQVALDITDDLTPTTVYAGKFSLQFCTALAIAKRCGGLQEFTLENVVNDELRSLMNKVHVSVNPDIEAGYLDDKWGAHVAIYMNDGQCYSGATAYPKGDFENPVSENELVLKFRALVQPYVDEEMADACIAWALNLGDMEDMSKFMQVETEKTRV